MTVIKNDLTGSQSGIYKSQQANKDRQIDEKKTLPKEISLVQNVCDQFFWESNKSKQK